MIDYPRKEVEQTMEWVTSIRKAIEYMENNLLNDISVQDVGTAVHVSTMYLQKGFTVMTGCSLGEYIRNRRLYQAALDLYGSETKIIDIAFRYAYDTPESFTKAFIRFHGATPSQIRNHEAHFKTFLPLRIELSINGGAKMDYQIVNKAGLQVIGFEREFSVETSNAEIPMFWDELFNKYVINVIRSNAPANAYEQAIADHHIGDYGICVDGEKDGMLRYIIGGEYRGGPVPDGMTVFSFDEGEWAVFDSIGPLPNAIQSLSERIYREWLPGNPDFELAGNANVEWYDPKYPDKEAPDYHSAVWIPVKRK